MPHIINTNATFMSESRKTYGSFPINMYVLNASRTGSDYLYYSNMNQNVRGWKLNATGDLTSSTVSYTSLPIKRDVIKSGIDGEIEGLSISIPNIDRTIESVIQNNNYLRGNGVHVITGFARYLPTGSTSEHIGATQDHNTFIKEKFYIDSVQSNESAVTFNCKSRFDINSIVIPARTFSRACAWALEIGSGYLGSECDASSNISATTFPTCNGDLLQCRERNNTKRFGGFVSIPRNAVFIT